MLKLNNINKTFGEKRVLKNINLEINQGEVFGLVGENGAGKTTLLNIISQVLVPTSGTVELDGKVIKSLNELKGKVGYILDIPALHDFLTAREYLEFLASPQKLKKEELTTITNTLLRRVGLGDDADKRIKGFSRGMRQRLGIAAGLVSNPEIVLMDEPSSALDPKGRADVLGIINELAEEGKTIILSTHILTDIEKICTRVGLLVNGEIDITGTVRDVLNAYQDNIYFIDCEKEDADDLISEISKFDFCEKAYKVKNGVNVNFKDGTKAQTLSQIKKLKTPYNGFNLKRSSIEEIFLKASSKKEKENMERMSALASAGLLSQEQQQLMEQVLNKTKENLSEDKTKKTKSKKGDE